MNRIIKLIVIFLGSIVGICVVGLGIYTISNYPGKIETFEIGTTEHPKQILIATQGTDFKDALTVALCEELKKLPLHIKVINIRDLRKEREEKWDRIILINSFVIRLNKHVSRFIQNVEKPEKVLVYISSGGADWQPQPNFNVDAVTSASRESYINELVQLISDWTDQIEIEKWEPEDYVLALNYFSQVDVLAASKAIKLEKEHYVVLYPNLANRINRAGYQFLRLNNLTAAMEVFRLNVQLFPEDWNVYDSYGEALYRSGDLDAAIKNYQKALDLNPGSESSFAMLRKITKKK